MKPSKVALITGANRGLGFETARQLAKKGIHVIITARDENNGKQALGKLLKEGAQASFQVLDVNSDASADQIFQFVQKEFGQLDILINNAGIMPENSDTIGAIREAFETNVLGVYRMCQRFVPLMQAQQYGRVVNVSSRMGQLSEMNGGYAAYRISKTAVNAITRIFADQAQGGDVKINSICPGWVKTDMGGPGAELTPEEGVDTIVWAATLPETGPTGAFLAEREKISW